jgi:hypothetical protein
MHLRGVVPRAFAALLPVTLALAWTGPGAGAAPNPPTAVTQVSPVTDSGALKPGYDVEHRYGGARCQSGSDTTGSAYRCFTPRSSAGVYDPCWVTASNDEVVCLTRPWLRRVVQLIVTGGYDDTDPMRPSAAPWGVQLTDGNRCLFQPGSVHAVNGRPVRYYCHHHVVLAGQFDRTHRQWQIRSYRNTTPKAADATYRWAGLAHVTTASFGAPSRQV